MAGMIEGDGRSILRQKIHGNANTENMVDVL